MRARGETLSHDRACDCASERNRRASNEDDPLVFCLCAIHRSHIIIAFTLPREGLKYRAMSTSAGLKTASPIKFGTSGWRGLTAHDFTFANIRLAVTAIPEHTNTKTKEATIL